MPSVNDFIRAERLSEDLYRSSAAQRTLTSVGTARYLKRQRKDGRRLAASKADRQGDSASFD